MTPFVKKSTMRMTASEINQKIKSVILAQSKMDGQISDITENELLFHNWNINEQTFMHFIQSLEKSFKLSFTDEEITLRNFESVNTISKLIEQKFQCPTNDASFFSSQTGDGISLALIDSGVAVGHPDFLNADISCYELQEDKFIPAVPGDQLGHGTACASILIHKAPSLKIYSLRVFEGNLKAHPQSVLAAFRWCFDHDIHIINASLGTVHENLQDQLLPFIDEAYRRNIVIVAAKNNSGQRSFPADLKHVVRVDSASVHEKFGFYYESGDTFSARGDLQKVARLDGDYGLSSGTSLAAAHLSGIFALILEKEGGRLPYEKLLAQLKARALPRPKDFSQSPKVKPSHPATNWKDKIHKIEQAAAFPADTSSEILVKYQSMLSFQLRALISIPGLFQNQYASGISKIDEILPQIDTLIVGNLAWASRIKQTDFYQQIFQIAEMHQKQIIVYGWLQQEKYKEYSERLKDKLCFISPAISPRGNLRWHSEVQFQSLRTPVLGLYAIDEIPRFFEYELQLRQLLTTTGYQVGQISNDPRGAFFNFDALCAGNSFYIENIIRCSGFALAETEKQAPDIILTGSSINFLSDTENPLQSARGLAYILGAHPDACILLANAGTGAEKIQRAIQILKFLVNSTVIYIIFIPFSDKVTTPDVGIPTTCETDISNNQQILTAIQRHFSD